MATFLDVTGLQHFGNLFAFIFVWLIVYALLSYSKALGNNNVINALIGLILGLFTLFSTTVTGAIIAIAPWFGLLFVFVILITVAGNMFGVGSDLTSTSAFKTIFITLVVIFVIVGFLVYARTNVDVPEEINEDSDFSKVTNILFHPKIIAMVFIMIIAVFVIALLTSKSV